MPSTALQRALGRDRAHKTQSTQLTRKLRNASNALARGRETAKVMGEVVVSDLESAGTLAVSCAAEGYYGDDRFKVRGIDLRGVVGLGAMAFGGYRKSKRKKDGAHVHAVGQGLVHSVLAGSAVRFGQRMAQEKATPAATQPAISQETTAQGVELDGIGAFLREVKLADSGLQPAHRL